MGDRYSGKIKCPICGCKDDYYYAPTCGITEWTCYKCEHIVNLEKYTGISREEASNKDVIEKLIRQNKNMKPAITAQLFKDYFNKLSVEAVQYPVVIRIGKDGRQLEYEIRDVYIYVDNNKKKLILYVKTDN